MNANVAQSLMLSVYLLVFLIFLILFCFGGQLDYERWLILPFDYSIVVKNSFPYKIWMIGTMVQGTV